MREEQPGRKELRISAELVVGVLMSGRSCGFHGFGMFIEDGLPQDSRLVSAWTEGNGARLCLLFESDEWETGTRGKLSPTVRKVELGK